MMPHSGRASYEQTYLHVDHGSHPSHRQTGRRAGGGSGLKLSLHNMNLRLRHWRWSTAIGRCGGTAIFAVAPQPPDGEVPISVTSAQRRAPRTGGGRGGYAAGSQAPLIVGSFYAARARRSRGAIGEMSCGSAEKFKLRPRKERKEKKRPKAIET